MNSCHGASRGGPLNAGPYEVHEAVQPNPIHTNFTLKIVYTELLSRIL